MSDSTFQWSMIGVTVAVIAWLAISIALRASGDVEVVGFPIPIGWSVIIGIVVWLVGGGLLLRYWGKRYMERE